MTLSRITTGPDSAFSLEPHELKAMVETIRTAEKALGEVQYKVSEHKLASRVFRRSLFVTRDIKAGERFTEDNVRSIRPAYGQHPRYWTEVLGCIAIRDIPRDTPMTWNLIEGSKEKVAEMREKVVRQP